MAASTVAAIAGAGALGAGLLSGGSSGSATSGATNASQLLAQIAQEQWNRYMDAFAPLEDQLLEEVQAPVTEQPGYASTMAQIDRGYADASANARRTLAGRYPNGAGIESRTASDLELGRSRDRASATADIADQRLERMMTVAGLGGNLQQGAISAAGSAASNYSRLANMQNQNTLDWWGLGLNAGTGLLNALF